MTYKVTGALSRQFIAQIPGELLDPLQFLGQVLGELSTSYPGEIGRYSGGELRQFVALSLELCGIWRTGHCGYRGIQRLVRFLFCFSNSRRNRTPLLSADHCNQEKS